MGREGSIEAGEEREGEEKKIIEKDGGGRNSRDSTSIERHV